MDGLKTLEKYPLATEILKEWFLKRMRDSFAEGGEVPEDFKTYIEETGFTPEKLSALITNSPRATFDMFDFYGIHICILVMQSTHENPTSYSYTIVPGAQDTDSLQWWDTRIEAEECAVEAAFETLNLKTLIEL